MRMLAVAKPELASKLLALHDPPVDDVGTAEQLGGAFELARSQRLAHRRAGNAFAEHGDAGHGFDRESIRTVLRTSRLQTCEVALPACAEAEVVADHEVFDAQAVDQYAGDEVFRGEPGQAGVEVADAGQRDAFLVISSSFSRRVESRVGAVCRAKTRAGEARK